MSTEEEEHFREMILPERVRAVEAELSGLLPEGLHVEFSRIACPDMQPPTREEDDMTHPTAHPLAGKTVTLHTKAPCPRGMVVDGAQFEVRDYADRLGLLSEATWPILHYASRCAGIIPVDHELVYGHINGLGHIVHVSELG